MNSRQGNLISGVVALGLVAFILYFSMDMPKTAAAFPRFIAAVLCVASLIMIVRTLTDKAPSKRLFDDIHWSTIAILGVAWVITILAIDMLGFIVPGIVFVAVISWYLGGKPKDKKSLAKIAAFAVGILISYWIVFHVVLTVSSPTEGTGLLW